jgi:hypothetical protein
LFKRVATRVDGNAVAGDLAADVHQAMVDERCAAAGQHLAACVVDDAAHHEARIAVARERAVLVEQVAGGGDVELACAQRSSGVVELADVGTEALADVERAACVAEDRAADSQVGNAQRSRVVVDLRGLQRDPALGIDAAGVVADGAGCGDRAGLHRLDGGR